MADSVHSAPPPTFQFQFPLLLGVKPMRVLLAALCAAFFVSAAHAQECTPPEEVMADMAVMYPDAVEVMREEIAGDLFIAFGADGVPTLLTFAYVDVNGVWCLADYFEVSADMVLGEGA